MFTDLHWITTGSEFRLATAARPRAGDWLDGELANWHRNGVRAAVSMLEDHENAELGLGNQAHACQKAGITFTSFPIADRDIPESRSSAISLAGSIAKSGLPTVIHCRAGIGRSSLMAATVLCELGMSPDNALQEISRARGLQVPDTQKQRDWILSLGRDI